MSQSEQLELAKESAPDREVSWFNSELKSKGFLFWKKMIPELIMDDWAASTTSIPAIEIHKIKDHLVEFRLPGETSRSPGGRPVRRARDKAGAQPPCRACR